MATLITTVGLSSTDLFGDNLSLTASGSITISGASNALQNHSITTANYVLNPVAVQADSRGYLFVRHRGGDTADQLLKIVVTSTVFGTMASGEVALIPLGDRSGTITYSAIASAGTCEVEFGVFEVTNT